MTDKPVLVAVTPEPASLDAIWWAANYARKRGSPLLFAHVALNVSSIVDRVRTRFPDVVVKQRFATGSMVDALVSESDEAHLIVIADECREVLPGRSAVAELGELARCPVVGIPSGVVWYEPIRPVVVGVHDRARSLEKVEFAFAEADRLGTGVRVVRCSTRRSPGGSTAQANALRHLIDKLTARYPDVPAQTEAIEGSPSRALAWHARFGSMTVLGSPRGGRVRGALFRSVSRDLRRRATSAVVVIGPHALATSRISPEMPFLDTARS